MTLPWWRQPRRSRSVTRRPRRPSVRPQLEALEDRRVPATLTVTTTADGGPGSLRQAILDSNASVGVEDTIHFAVGSGVQVIQPTAALPAITDTVTLDGTTQPGFGGTPVIVLDGSKAGTVHGLVLAAGSGSATSEASLIRGLVINHFAGAGVLIQTTANHLENDYLGTDVTGTAAAGNAVGVDIRGANANGIGGPTAAQGVLVSGNAFFGVRVQGGSGNSVINCKVGTSADGRSALGNGLDGVAITGGATQTHLLNNVISGNVDFGVFIEASSNNDLEQNLVGMATGGSTPLRNGFTGVFLSNAANNIVGGVNTAQVRSANVLSGNGAFGVFVLGSASTGNLVEGNLIGIAADGTTAAPNTADGVFLFQAPGNTVGGTTAGQGNAIAGNGRFGVFLLGAGTTNNVVEDNLIGVSGAGGALPNGFDGVALFPGAAGNTIGGTATNAGNVISGNGRFGVFLLGPGEPSAQGAPATAGNVIQGNRIGTSVFGDASLPNRLDGVALLNGADGNTVGGTTAAARNVIAGNLRDGLFLQSVSGNVVTGNFAGVNAGGTAALPNGANGVALALAAGNTVGGTTAGAGNVLSGNAEGVVLVGAGTTGNLVQGNSIGTDLGGTRTLGNLVGVDVLGGAVGNTIGGTATGAANVISNNTHNGVTVGSSAADSATVGDSVLGNSIFNNGGLGIDLGNDSVTANTAGSPHTGPNHLQGFPVLNTVAASAGNGVDVSVTLDSTPGHTFRLEFFASTAADASGFGEGQSFLGAATVMTGANGTVTQPVHLPAELVAGRTVVTATATDQATGDTSEFSAAVNATVAGGPLFFFNSGSPDGKMAMASNPPGTGVVEREAADDFPVAAATTVTGARFTGLVTGGGTVGEVAVEIYRVFPKDSNTARTITVPTRTNSPSDAAFDSRDTATAGQLAFTTTTVSANFMAANSVLNGIHPSPNQKTGGEGPVSGQEVQFDVTFTTPLNLPADTYFFVPQVQLTGGQFYWLSAAKPITGPGTTPFTPDLQAWIRNAALDPDWLRVGTDIVGAGAFNASFALKGTPAVAG